MKNILFAIGEALIDFIPDKTGCDFSDITSFSPKVGGAPANVLGAFAKLGGRTQLITQLGNDLFGNKIIKELSEFGIGLDYVTVTDAANTALAFVSLDNSGDREFSFYRNPSADMLCTAENITAAELEDCYALHFCSVSLGNFPMKKAHTRVIELAKENGAVISFDPNIRLPLWKDTSELKSAIKEFLPYADIVKVSEDEVELVTGETDAEKGCRRLLESAELVLCTCGSHGAYAYTKNCSVFVPSKKVAVKDTTGAGDAFCGSLLYGLYSSGAGRGELRTLTEERLAELVGASVNYCAESVQRYGAIESYPYSL